MNTTTHPLRVIDSVDDLASDLAVQQARINATRAACMALLHGLGGTPTITANTAPTITVTKPTLTAVPAVEYHTCPVCGDVVPSARGLAIHKGLKHKAITVTKPITRTSVNEQAAHEAAARAL